ncbi:MAG: hypothetical protein ABSH41_23480 [Syntrophobacteraceae bacterium]
MKVQTRDIINVDAKPSPGIIVETGPKSFRAYFSGVNGEEAEVLEFERRDDIDAGELNVLISRTYQELSGSTIPEDGEFFLNGNRAVFAMVRAFRVVSFNIWQETRKTLEKE